MLERVYRHFGVLLDSEMYSSSPAGNDVEDEHALELEDTPGTTTGKTFCSLARIYFLIFGQMWLLTTGPLIGVTVLFAELA